MKDRIGKPSRTGRAVNARLTLRNWLIGFHAEEYERRRVDRAEFVYLSADCGGGDSTIELIARA